MDWPPIRYGQFDDESHEEKAERRETGAEPEDEKHRKTISPQPDRNAIAVGAGNG